MASIAFLAQAAIDQVRAGDRHSAENNTNGFPDLCRVADHPSAGDEEHHAAQQQPECVKLAMMRVSVQQGSKPQYHRKNHGAVFQPGRGPITRAQQRQQGNHERRKQAMHGARGGSHGPENIPMSRDRFFSHDEDVVRSDTEAATSKQYYCRCSRSSL